MTEEDAHRWLRDHDVSRETQARLECLVACVTEEATRQNLIAVSTIPQIWARHIVDSVQLLAHAPTSGSWLDLGSGAGFPGVAVAAFGQHRITLVESRTKRAEFLTRTVAAMGVTDWTEVAAARLETLPQTSFDIISARAFAPLDRLLAVAHRFAHRDTCWILPKGRGAAEELAVARNSWQGEFRQVQSVTDPESAILLATHVSPGGRHR